MNPVGASPVNAAPVGSPHTALPKEKDATGKTEAFADLLPRRHPAGTASDGGDASASKEAGGSPHRSPRRKEKKAEAETAPTPVVTYLPATVRPQTPQGTAADGVVAEAEGAGGSPASAKAFSSASSPLPSLSPTIAVSTSPVVPAAAERAVEIPPAAAVAALESTSSASESRPEEESSRQNVTDEEQPHSASFPLLEGDGATVELNNSRQMPQTVTAEQQPLPGNAVAATAGNPPLPSRQALESASTASKEAAVSRSASAEHSVSHERLETGSAKIAGQPEVSFKTPAAGTPDPGNSAAPAVIQHADGMSVAMEHPAMPPVNPQPVKNALRPAAASAEVEGAASLEGASQREEPAAQAAASESRDQNGEGNGAAPDGADLMGTFLPAAPREVQAKFQAEAAPKAASPQETATVFHHTVEAAERMRSDGRNNVEIQVRLHDGQELTIQLRMDSGEFHPVFKTESADLRAALQQHWNQFTSDSADRGLRIAAPVFESGQSGMGSFHDRQERQSQQSVPFFTGEEASHSSRPKPAAAAEPSPAVLPENQEGVALFA